MSRPRRTGKKRSAASAASAQLLFAFFLSGFAGLMHQVVWAKLLVRLIGSTAVAQATVLAVFMAGLAAGALFFGRRADRRLRPLRTYLALEVAIGVYCLALPLLVSLGGLGYVALASQFFESTGLKLVLRLGLAALVVLAPAVWMGGTLPVLARHLIRSLEETRHQVANLYALNSFGAALGAAVAGFLALPSLGVHGALVWASMLNFVAAALVWRPAVGETLAADSRETRSHKKRRRPHESRVERAPYGSAQYGVALGALALTGFAAMGYEVLFTRVIALAFGASAYSFSIMLTCFIAGIALGSAIVSRLKVNNPLWLFGASQLAVVVALLAATPLVERLPFLITQLRVGLQGAPLGFELYQLGKAALCLVVLLVPTTCLGFSFPLVAQIEVRQPDRIGTSVGSTYAWNTLGNVLGALGTALVLLPVLGTLNAFHLNLVLNASAALAVLWVAREVPAARRLVAVGVAGLALAVYAGGGAGWLDSIQLAPNHLHLRAGPAASLDAAARAMHHTSSFEAWQRSYVLSRFPEKILLFEEDSHNTVLVVGEGESVVLFVNGKPDASSNPQDLGTQLLLGHAPLFLAPRARSLLVIGHGSGITAGAALLHPIETADVVEISRGVLEADAVFAVHNHRVLSDRRVRVYEEDGQSFLRTTPRRYDLIVSEPSNPWMAGVSDLFTVEFLESARDRLNPGGVFTFWFHTYWQSDETVQMLLRTMRSVFPHVVLVADNDFGNVIAVGSERRMDPDFPAMERRYQTASIRRDLARMGIPGLEALLSHFRISGPRIDALAGGGPLNTVGRQRLEYAAPRSFFSGENSFVLDGFDPLIQGEPPANELLLDRYLSHRAARGDPVSDETLIEAARYAQGMGGYGGKVARSILARRN
jgi:spermidine synthase/MFS family permease